MKYFSLIFLTLCVTSTQSTLAATAFDDEVPAEVVTQLIDAMLGGQARLYRDLPDNFPPFALSDDLTILAGVDQGWSQRVILKSRFDYQATIALAYRALLDAGWQLVPRPGTQLPQNGFINPQQPAPQTQLCHITHGYMDVSIQASSSTTYVNLIRNVLQPGMPSPACDTVVTMAPMQPPIPPQMQLQQQLQDLMPCLVLPRITEMTARGGYAGGAGLANEWEVRAALDGDWNMQQVFRHFATQIEEQGWKRDVRVSGDVMASGSWTKIVDENELIGNFTVLVTGDNSYDLRFRLLRQGTADAGIQGFGIRGIPAGIRGVRAGP